jgi:hypothetical protein
MPALRITTNVLGTVAAVLLGTTALCSSVNAALVTLRQDQLAYRDRPSTGYKYGVFEFTYDDSTPDIFPDDPEFGRYENPLIAGRMTLGHRVFELDTSMPTGASMEIGWKAALWGTFLELGSNTPYRFSGGIENFEIRTDALNEFIGIRRMDSSPFFLERLDHGSQDFDPMLWTYGVYTLVPLPPAVYLFTSALGVMGWMRRKAIA